MKTFSSYKKVFVQFILFTRNKNSDGFYDNKEAFKEKGYLNNNEEGINE